MSMTASLSRRALLAGLGALTWCWSGFGAHAQDTAPLRLGVLTDMSSLYADITGPGSVAAAKMAVEDFLASPHKIKRPIEVISADHMNKSDAGANIAREWLDRGGIDAIIDTPNSAVALAVRNVVEQKKGRSWCPVRRRPTLPASPVRRIWSIGPMTPMRCPQASRAPWSRPAARPGLR